MNERARGAGLPFDLVGIDRAIAALPCNKSSMKLSRCEIDATKERRMVGPCKNGIQGRRGRPQDVGKSPLNRPEDGGRDRDRTCDPYDVNVVLSR